MPTNEDTFKTIRRNVQDKNKIQSAYYALEIQLQQKAEEQW
jgi:hypothetical protein